MMLQKWSLTLGKNISISTTGLTQFPHLMLKSKEKEHTHFFPPRKQILLHFLAVSDNKLPVSLGWHAKMFCTQSQRQKKMEKKVLFSLLRGEKGEKSTRQISRINSRARKKGKTAVDPLNNPKSILPREHQNLNCNIMSTSAPRIVLLKYNYVLYRCRHPMLFWQRNT